MGFGLTASHAKKRTGASNESEKILDPYIPGDIHPPAGIAERQSASAGNDHLEKPLAAAIGNSSFSRGDIRHLHFRKKSHSARYVPVTLRTSHRPHPLLSCRLAAHGFRQWRRLHKKLQRFRTHLFPAFFCLPLFRDIQGNFLAHPCPVHHCSPVFHGVFCRWNMARQTLCNTGKQEGALRADTHPHSRLLCRSTTPCAVSARFARRSHGTAG